MIGNVAALYHMKAQHPERALREACREFESIFVHQLLKATGSGVGEGFMGEGLSGEISKDLLYMAMARGATAGEGIGIAQVLYERIARIQGISAETPTQTSVPLTDKKEGR